MERPEQDDDRAEDQDDAGPFHAVHEPAPVVEPRDSKRDAGSQIGRHPGRLAIAGGDDHEHDGLHGQGGQGQLLQTDGRLEEHAAQADRRTCHSGPERRRHPDPVGHASPERLSCERKAGPLERGRGCVSVQRPQHACGRSAAGEAPAAHELWPATAVVDPGDGGNGEDRTEPGHGSRSQRAECRARALVAAQHAGFGVPDRRGVRGIGRRIGRGQAHERIARQQLVNADEPHGRRRGRWAQQPAAIDVRAQRREQQEGRGQQRDEHPLHEGRNPLEPAAGEQGPERFADGDHRQEAEHAGGDRGARVRPDESRDSPTYRSADARPGSAAPRAWAPRSRRPRNRGRRAAPRPVAHRRRGRVGLAARSGSQCLSHRASAHPRRQPPRGS